MAEHLAGHGRRVAGWDELVDAGVPASTTIFSWRDESRVAAARAAGHPVVAVPQQYTYLDWPEVDAPGEPIGIPNGVTPLDRVYGFDPGDVFGVQGQLWSEYLPVPAAVEWRALPRLTAIAEIGWTGPGGDFPDFRRRVAAHTPRWDTLGLNYRPLD
jgi:hexosaminidase